jgi:hypothetical protein
MLPTGAGASAPASTLPLLLPGHETRGRQAAAESVIPEGVPISEGLPVVDSVPFASSSHALGHLPALAIGNQALAQAILDDSDSDSEDEEDRESIAMLQRLGGP